MRISLSTNFIRSFLTLVLTCSSVFAFAQRMTPEDFRNFSRAQKVEVIQSMQMFAVNIEKMHYQSIKRKYSYQTLRYLLESIVSKAVADEVIENDKLCIYAGWISYIPKNSKSSRCAHPNSYRESQVPEALKDVIAKEHKRYENFKGTFGPKECSNPGKIMCNPQLFGHTPGVEKPFCVDGNPNSENSSFQCLKKVETSNKKEEILDIIIEENLAEDKTQRLQRLMSMIDDACMCESPNNMIDQKYAKRMYKTQTCFSWVSQVRNISRRACKMESRSDKDISSIIELSQNLYSKAQNELMATGISDVEYTNIVEGGEWSNKNWKSRTEEYKDFCEKKKVYAIKISQGKVKGLILASLTLDGKPLDMKGYEIKWYKGKDELKGKKQGLSINVDPAELPAKIHAKLVKSGNEEAKSNELDLQDEKKYEISIAKDKTLEGVQSLKAIVKINDKEINEKELKAYKITWYSKQVDSKKPETKENNKEPSKEKENSFDESNISFITTKLKELSKEITVHAILSQSDKELADSNELSFEDPTKYEIGISKGEEKDKKVILTASPKINGKEIEPEEMKKYEIIWKDPKGETLKNTGQKLDLEVSTEPTPGEIYVTLHEKEKEHAKSDKVDFSVKELKYNIGIKKTSIKGTKQLIAATVTLDGKPIKASELAEKGLEVIWFEKLAENTNDKKTKPEEEKEKQDLLGDTIEKKKEDEISKNDIKDPLGEEEDKEKKKENLNETDKDGFKTVAKSNESLDASSEILDQKKIVIAKLKTKDGKLIKSNDVNFMRTRNRNFPNRNLGGQVPQIIKRRVLHLNGVR